jgi:hypothetical protein
MTNDIIDNGKTLVQYAPELEDKASPTLAEIEAGIRLSDKITADGMVGFEPDTGDIDNTSLESEFGTVLPGRAAYSGQMLRLKRQEPLDEDEAYDTLQRGVFGYLIVRRYQRAAEPFAEGDLVEVYPIACGETRHLTPESGDSVARYEVPTKIHDEPVLRATIAA